jgi:hypothetical protein
MYALAAKITAALATFVTWFGFVLPTLISSTDSLSVIAGFVMTGFWLVWMILSIGREVLELKKQRKERKRR